MAWRAKCSRIAVGIVFRVMAGFNGSDIVQTDTEISSFPCFACVVRHVQWLNSLTWPCFILQDVSEKNGAVPQQNKLTLELVQSTYARYCAHKDTVFRDLSNTKMYLLTFRVA